MSDFENWADEELSRLKTGTNLKRPSDNQSMFKYIGLNSETSWDYLRRSLHNSELVGASARSLNDPFELSPSTFDDLQPSTIAAAVRHNDLRDRLAGKEVKSVEEVYADPAPYRQQANAFLESIVERYRIVAFCERCDSGLLWSHYANSYRGACLHFLGKGFRYQWDFTLGYVNYSKYRPVYPLSLALTLSTKPRATRDFLRRAESEKILFFTKADDWSYESEIRLIYESNDNRKIVFQPEGLVSIIVGPKFSDENRRKLSDLLKGSPYEKIAIRTARLSQTTFSVEID